MPILSDISLPVNEGMSVRDRVISCCKKLPANSAPNTLRIALIREPFDDYYLIYLIDSGSSEELEEDNVRKYLEDRGADDELVQKSITQAWNFYSAILTIKNPKMPKNVDGPLLKLSQ